VHWRLSFLESVSKTESIHSEGLNDLSRHSRLMAYVQRIPRRIHDVLQRRGRFLYCRVNQSNDHSEVRADSPSQQGPPSGLGTEMNAFGLQAKHGARDGDAMRISYGSAVESGTVV